MGILEYYMLMNYKVETKRDTFGTFETVAECKTMEEALNACRKEHDSQLQLRFAPIRITLNGQIVRYW